MLAIMALAAAPLMLLGDTAIAFARGWETTSRLDALLIAVVALSLFVIVTMALIQRFRTALQRAWAQIVLLVFASFCAFIAIEVASALYLRQFVVPPHMWRPNSQTAFDVLPGTMHGVNGKSKVSTNSIGIRGPELPADRRVYRILCVGGSTTECIYLDDTETWPHLVMEQLNNRVNQRPVWVGNVGRSGFATDQHLSFLRESKLVADMDCVVLLVGANDLSKFLSKGEGFGTAWDEFVSRDLRLRPLWRRSSLLDLVRRTYHALTVKPIAVEDSSGTVYVTRRDKRKVAPITDQLPELTELNGYRHRIQEIIAVCRAKSVRPVFVTQPMLYATQMSPEAQALIWGGWLEDGSYLSVKALMEGMDQYNRTLRAVCDELIVECIDLTSMNGNEDFFYDDAHFTEAGAKEVARLVADGLLQHPLN